MRAREAGDGDGVVEEVVLDVDARGDGLELHDVARVEHRRATSAASTPCVLSICASSRARRVAHRDADEEAVDLRLGQRVGPLEVDGVLRGEDEERERELEAVALDGDLPLLHRLEQRALGLGGRAVDLVGEDDVREDGAGAERERAVPRREDVGAGDVGRAGGRA